MVTQSSGKKYHGTLTKKLFRDMSRSAMQFLAMFLLLRNGHMVLQWTGRELAYAGAIHRNADCAE